MENSVVRNGVFETNSSSTHSISIASGSYVPDRIPIHDGVVAVYSGEFGSGGEEDSHSFNDIATKLSYAYTYASNCGRYNDPTDPRPQQLLDMIEKVIKKVTNAKQVYFHKHKSKWSPTGYIDHMGEHGEAAIFESDKSLAQFLFNPSSQVSISINR